MTILQKFENLRPFTETEAWNLFRLAAVSEAIGWSLLISGLLIKRFVMHGNNDAVLLAGQIHGTIFLAYIAAVLVLYASLGWSRRRTIVAGLASVPPYGSLVFEQWAAHKRRGELLKTYREMFVRAIIVQDGRALAVQPKDSGFWHLPGGAVQARETAEQALTRIVAAQTGIAPKVGRLAYVWQYRHKATERLELFFVVENADNFDGQTMKARLADVPGLDDIAYLDLKNNADVQPAFLRTEPGLAQTATRHQMPTKFITSEP